MMVLLEECGVGGGEGESEWWYDGSEWRWFHWCDDKVWMGMNLRLGERKFFREHNIVLKFMPQPDECVCPDFSENMAGRIFSLLFLCGGKIPGWLELSTWKLFWSRTHFAGRSIFLKIICQQKSTKWKTQTNCVELFRCQRGQKAHKNFPHEIVLFSIWLHSRYRRKGFGGEVLKRSEKFKVEFAIWSRSHFSFFFHHCEYETEIRRKCRS